MSNFQRLIEEADVVSQLVPSSILLPSIRRDCSSYDEKFRKVHKHMIKDTEDSDNEIDLGEEKDNSQDKALLVQESDFVKLRAYVKHLSIHPTNNLTNSVIGTYYQEEHKPVDKSVESGKRAVHFVPVTWEKEVRDLMAIDDDDEDTAADVEEKEEDDIHIASTKTPSKPATVVTKQVAKTVDGAFRPLQSMEGNLAPYSCFDPDFVDIDGQSDDLDRVFPNDDTVVEMTVDEQRMPSSGSGSAMRDLLFQTISKKINEQLGRNVQQEPEVIDDATRASEERNRRAAENFRKKKERLSKLGTWINATATLKKNATRRAHNASLLAADNQRDGVELNHHPCAQDHKSTRADLTEYELKHFHKPMVKENEFSWEFEKKATPATTTVTSSKKSRHISRIAQAEKERLDLSVTSPDSHFVLIEFVEERPPLILNNGMTSVVINYFRQKDDDENTEEANEEEQQSQAVKKLRISKISKMEISNIKELLGKGVCKLPRHVTQLWDLSMMKRSYDYDANIPSEAIGMTKVLSMEDPSPFIAEIDRDRVQPALVNALFRAPLFAHDPKSSDFLLVVKKKSKSEKKIEFILRSIPHLFLSGQMEPRMIAPRPVYTREAKLSKAQEGFLKLAVKRFMDAHKEGDGVDLAALRKTLLPYSSNTSAAPHKWLIRNRFIELVKAVAHIKGNQCYAKNYNDDDDDNEDEDVEKTLARSFAAEDVCAMESSDAAEYMLAKQNIYDIELPTLKRYLDFLHRHRNYQEERQKAWMEATAGYDSSVTHALNKMLEQEIHRTKVRQDIARHLFDRLIRAPWNTTEAFVQSVIVKDKKGFMDVKGRGDPSGRNEGFAFVRISAADQAQLKRVEDQKKKGTSKDLRKLHVGEAIALCLRLGVEEKRAKAMKRWDRIHIIRTIITAMARKNRVPPELMIYARGDEVTEDDFNEYSQQIWKKQVDALSSKNPPLRELDRATLKQAKKKYATNTAATHAPSLKRQISEDTSIGDDDVQYDSDDFEDAEELTRRLLERNNPTMTKSSSSSSANATGPAFANLSINYSIPSHWERPRKVVKKITRKIDANGKEEVKVEFFFDENDVNRVEYQAQMARKRRNDLREGKTMLQEDKDIAQTEEIVQQGMKSTVLNLKKMETMVQKGISRGEAIPARGNLMDFVVDDEEAKVSLQVKSSKRSAVANFNQRIPHISLAARFEKELMEIWNSKDAVDFLYAVPTNTPGYYERITQPICLSDMFEKVTNFVYDNRRQVLDDMRLMAQNSQLYNGPQSIYTKKANSLYDRLEQALNHDRIHLGDEKDEIGLMEKAVEKKKILQKRV